MPSRNTIEIIITSEDKASPKVKSLSSILQTSLGVAIGNLAAQQIPKLVGGLKNIVKESVNAAARVQELGFVAQLLGQRAGFSADQVNEYVKGITEAGIRTDVAQNLVAQFARRNLDLSKSVDIARVAQDAAVLSMTDSSEALDRILLGVTTYNKRILRTAGLNVDIQGSFVEMANQLGKTTEELTEQEKVEAALNGVMREGAAISGVYAAAMETPGKQARSLSRHIYELTRVIGEPFLDAFGSAVGIVGDFVKSLRAAFEEGGILHPILQKIGAGAAIVAERLRTVAKSATEAGTSFVANFSSKMGAAAENALRWGIKISTELATGLIKGAVAALNAAMTFIGNMLASWLGPGSPPRVAPDIDQWGAAAFTEYLRGFGDAEFGILEGLQGPIQSALSALVDMGELGAEDALPLFKELTFGITEALDEFRRTGTVGSEVFDRLREAGGQFGDELAELARRQLALAAATDEVQRAEENLANARQMQERAQQTVDELADEYNRLLAAGADPAILKAKKKEFEEAKKQLALSKKNVKEAERQEAQAKATVDPLKEQVSLQERLLKQLIDFSKVQEEAVQEKDDIADKIAGGIAAGVAAIADIPAPLLEPPNFDLVTASFAEAKEGLASKFSDLFSPLTTAWEEDIQPALEGLGNTWTWFTGVVKDFWDEKVQPVIDEFKKLIPPGLVERFGEIAGAVGIAALAFAGLSAIVGVVSGILGFLLSPIGLIIAAIAALALIWETNFLGIRDALTQFWEEHARPALEGLALWLGENIPKAMEALKNFWDEHLAPAFETIKLWAEENIPKALETLASFWEETLKPALEVVWKFIDEDLLPLFRDIKELFDVGLKLAVEAMSGLWEKTLKPALEGVWKLIKEDLAPIWDTLMEKFENAKIDIIEPLKGALDKVGVAIGKVRDFIKDLTEKLKSVELPDWMSPGSPTPWELGIKGVSAAMRELSQVEIPRLEAGFGNLNAAQQRTGPVTTNNFNMTVNTQATTSTVMRDFATLTALAT